MSEQLRSNTNALLSTAYHEAGHAVVAWLCDHTLGEVTIRRDRQRGNLGKVQHSEYGDNDLFGLRALEIDDDAPGGFVVRTSEQEGRHLTDLEMRWVNVIEQVSGSASDEQHVMIAAAGSLAERKLSSERVDPDQSRGDWEAVCENLKRLAKERDESIDEARDRITALTVSLLDDPLVWSIVEGFAGELFNHETLTGGEAKRAIEQRLAVSFDRLEIPAALRADLRSHLWHVTNETRFLDILRTEQILPEPPIPDSQRYATGEGPDLYPYCRSIGAISLFDFAAFEDDAAYSEDYPVSNWREFLHGPPGWKAAVWLAIPRASVGTEFVSAKMALEGWRQGNPGRRIMPMIEACHVGALPIAQCAFAVMICSANPNVFRRIDVNPFDKDAYDETLSEWEAKRPDERGLHPLLRRRPSV